MFKKLFFSSFFLLFFIPHYANQIDSREIETSLRRLDQVISERSKYEQQNKEEIDKKRLEYKKAQTPDEQYNTLRDLFNLYRTYKVDSALIVADRRLQAAQAIGEPSKIYSATLNLADGYSKTGNLDKSISILDTIDINLLLPNQIKYLNNIYKTVYYNKAVSSLLSRDRLQAFDLLNQYRNKEWEEADHNSRGFMALQAEKLRDAGLNQEAVAVMEEVQKKFDIEDNAALLFELGQTYLEAGMDDNAIAALSKAAILDITGGSKEYMALTLLASLLYDRGEVERAFAYINCALEDAISSKAQIRTEEVLKIMPNIYKAYAEKEKEIKRRNVWFFTSIGVLNLVLIFLIILLFREHKVKKKMIKDINEMNRLLETQNISLESADKIKMTHLKSFMLAYSMHIARLKDFRKNIGRLIKTTQYSKALEKIKSEKEDSPDNAAFQEMFDSAFLSMFPNFVEDINKFFKIPLEQKNSDRLTPELRLVALMKLGITSTNEISEMFQYSPQSVYNLRSTLRTMLNVSWEEFEEAVAGS